MHQVVLCRSKYVGNRSSIEEWHAVLSIGVDLHIEYNGLAPVGYRFSFHDPRHAMFFKLRWS